MSIQELPSAGMSVRDAAREYGFSIPTLYRRMADSGLPSVVVKRRRVILRSDFERWLRSQGQQAAA